MSFLIARLIQRVAGVPRWPAAVLVPSGELMQQCSEDMRPSYAINLIETIFHSIEQMSNGERESVMHLLRGWILIEKFGAEGRAALHALHKCCVAECLLNDASWTDHSPFRMIGGAA